MPINVRGDIFLAVKPEIVGVAGANMQCSRFLGPQLQSKEGEHCIWINEALGDFQVPVSNLVEVVLHVEKRAKFWVGKWTRAKIYAAEMPVLEMGRILKNKLSVKKA